MPGVTLDQEGTLYSQCACPSVCMGSKRRITRLSRQQGESRFGFGVLVFKWEVLMEVG